MYRFLLSIFFCSIPGLLLAQNPIDPSKRIDTAGKKDIINVARSIFHINTKPDTSKKGKAFYFSILPISNAVPGGGRAIFTSTTAGFYTGDRTTTYLSTISFAPYFNFHGRYGLPFRSSICLKDNSWAIMGDTRFLVYPQ